MYIQTHALYMYVYHYCAWGAGHCPQENIIDPKGVKLGIATEGGGESMPKKKEHKISVENLRKI